MRRLILFVTCLFLFSCSSKKEQKENRVLPISSAKISEGKGEVFDTIEFSRTKGGLYFVMDSLQNIEDRPDMNSHVTVEYKITAKEGVLIYQKDSTDSAFQLYVSECNKLLADAICLLGRKSEAKIVLDSENVEDLYPEVKKNENYLVDLRLLDFHQHYD